VIDPDDRVGSVRAELRDRYLGFAHAGLHFTERDISPEIAEARRRLTEHLGREPQLPARPRRAIYLWLVTDTTDEIIGTATREVGRRGAALVVAHRQLRIWPARWRGRGFGTALLAENRDWYRDCAVTSIVMEAEGDGSAFAAVRGFDFDVDAYADRPGLRGLSERDIRLTAVDRLIRHPAIGETVDGRPAGQRESVAALLQRLEADGDPAAGQVRRLQRRLPRQAAGGAGAVTGAVTGDRTTFTAPHEIAAFGADEPLQALGDRSLGQAVLARSGWSGITAL
jgi:hypothetical protein